MRCCCCCCSARVQSFRNDNEWRGKEEVEELEESEAGVRGGGPRTGGRGGGGEGRARLRRTAAQASPAVDPTSSQLSVPQLS